MEGTVENNTEIATGPTQFCGGGRKNTYPFKIKTGKRGDGQQEGEGKGSGVRRIVLLNKGKARERAKGRVKGFDDGVHVHGSWMDTFTFN